MKEIPNEEWGEFFRRLSEFEREAVVDIDRLERDGRKTEVARKASFQEITFGRRNECSDQITLLSSGGEKPKHDIVEPLYVRLQETEQENGFNSLIIGAEDGVTIVTFHPVIRLPWLEGLRIQ